MDADTRRALSILDAFAKLPKEVGPVTLSQDYLDHIARVEALPENQAGADKSWVPCAWSVAKFFPSPELLFFCSLKV